MDVRVTRSRRRKKTVEARLVDGEIRLAIPSAMSRTEEAYWVEEMRRRFARRIDTTEIDLAARAARLAARHNLPSPDRIEWSGRQRSRWGSCTVESAAIRISDRLAAFPRWVLDYVIVHELAHLHVPDHSPAFWELVGRYPLAERARGYLIAKAGEDAD